MDPSVDVHPWEQFRQGNKNDAKHYKSKDSESKFKAKHTSYFMNKLPFKEWKQHKLLKMKEKSANKQILF